MKRDCLQFCGAVQTIRLDITKQQSVDQCFAVVTGILNRQKAKLWALVNNAGFCAIYGPNDWVTMDEYKTSIEINLLGTIRMTKTFTPLLKRSRGRLVTMVSISGRIHGFYTAPYVTAKYALQGFMDSVRLELRPFGVSAHIIEPGAFKTTLLNKNAMLERVNVTWNKLSKDVQEEYGEEFKEN
uniref:D-beta-hydroxybutyrate dehydrogenase, mitochondrial n=2 Tax=Bursaphelenchus xylophilus TaxID=6326 RepID=A0A1I7SJA4_BURXY